MNLPLTIFEIPKKLLSLEGKVLYHSRVYCVDSSSGLLPLVKDNRGPKFELLISIFEILDKSLYSYTAVP